MSDENAAYIAEYRALRGRVRDLLSAYDAAALERPAPATPEWRVRDVLAHVVGVPDDSLHGRLDGVTTAAWTAAQVDARRERDVAAVLDEWDVLGPAFEDALVHVPSIVAGQVLADATAHEHDIRHALGAPGARDAPALALVFDWMITVRSLSPPQSRIAFDIGAEAGDGPITGGEGAPVATVRASRFEIVRASTGRRSASEIARYDWSTPTDPAAMLLSTDLFRLRDEPLDE
jgi:uncharacterized protein (TIGR03083 family)